MNEKELKDLHKKYCVCGGRNGYMKHNIMMHGAGSLMPVGKNESKTNHELRKLLYEPSTPL